MAVVTWKFLSIRASVFSPSARNLHFRTIISDVLLTARQSATHCRNPGRPVFREVACRCPKLDEAYMLTTPTSPPSRFRPIDCFQKVVRNEGFLGYPLRHLLSQDIARIGLEKRKMVALLLGLPRLQAAGFPFRSSACHDSRHRPIFSRVRIRVRGRACTSIRFRSAPFYHDCHPIHSVIVVALRLLHHARRPPLHPPLRAKRAT